MSQNDSKDPVKPSDLSRPLTRQQRRAAERSLRKAAADAARQLKREANARGLTFRQHLADLRARRGP